MFRLSSRTPSLPFRPLPFLGEGTDDHLPAGLHGDVLDPDHLLALAAAALLHPWKELLRGQGHFEPAGLSSDSARNRV